MFKDKLMAAFGNGICCGGVFKEKLTVGFGENWNFWSGRIDLERFCICDMPGLGGAGPPVEVLFAKNRRGPRCPSP